MAVLEGKTTNERNKIIAAGLLGLLALVTLYFAFLRGGSSTPTAKTTPTPRASVTSGKNALTLPSSEEQAMIVTQPIVYEPGNVAFAPDAGRNIFAFYEPPAPTPYSPTPIPPVIIPPPSPTPTPVFLAGYMNPQMIYAGSKAFRLEVNGDRFTPDARIYFSQNEIPTTFINAQKLVADIPANFIAQEGPRQIIVQTPDGTKYSNQMMLQVQAPPRPTFQYIGMIARKRGNNDTAYLMETGKTVPFGARLNDILGGRFRLTSISSVEVVFEDTSLGFRHRVPIAKQANTGSGPTVQPGRGGFPEGGFQPFTPSGFPQGDIPGIPANVPRYVPPQPQRTPPQKKEDVDDDGDGL